MKTILKNFLYLFTKFRTSSILNILGLSVAFVVFIIVFLQVHYDFSFNRNFKKSKDIYLYSHYWSEYFTQERLVSISVPLAEKIAKGVPEIKNYCLIKEEPWVFKYDIPDSNGNIRVANSILIKATKGFLDLFEPEILEGSPEGVFEESNKAMISKSIAENFFGREDPIGKSFFIHNSEAPIIVTAVYKDFPDNCSMKNGIYTYLPGDREGLYNYTGYFEIDKVDIESVTRKMNGKDFLEGVISEVELIPLLDVHFNVPYIGKGDKTLTLSLIAIALLILIIAYINFLNFSISISPVRVKSISIQKILGADSTVQKLSFQLEAVLFSAFAFLLSLFYLILLKNSFINYFLTADISLQKNIIPLIFIGIVILIIGFLFGLYPANYIASVKATVALSGSFSHSLNSKRLKNILIIVQFTASMVLIVVSGFIKIQHDYMKNYSWGIQTEHILYVSYPDLDSNAKTFGEELIKNPDIIDCTASQFLPGWVIQEFGINFRGEKMDVKVWPVEFNFLNFFGINIIEGRDFTESDNNQKIILNQKFLQTHNFKDIIGHNFGDDDEDIEIIGIMEDVNFESLRSEIKPMGLILLPEDEKWNEWMFIKISGNNIYETIEFIGSIWKKLSKEEFNIYFLDSTLDSLYNKENNLSKLLSLFSLVIVLIAIMGVYGLILLNSGSKQKEIAIRKVNGASIIEIIFMLNSNMIRQLIIAFIIMIPVSYFIVKYWLSNFAYRTSIYWWVFLLGGIIVFIVTLLTVSSQSYNAASQNPTNVLNKE